MPSTTASRPPSPAGIRGAFRVKRRSPYPWARAISSGLSEAIPILAGIWSGQFELGLLAALGGWAYLYTSSEPYSRRAVKLLAVSAGLAVCFGLGSYTSAISVWLAAPVLGLVSAGAVFVCEGLDVASPSALFFIYLCAIGTSMPTRAPAELLTLSGVVLLGGVPAWFISMSGWLFDPHGPEAKAVVGSYRALAAWLAAFGTPDAHAAQHRAAEALRSSQKVLAASSVPLRRSGAFYRLLRLNQQADAIFLAIIARTAETAEPIDPKLSASVRALADAVRDPDRAASLAIPEPVGERATMVRLHRELLTAVSIAAAEGAEPVEGVPAAPRTLWGALLGALDPNSLILPRALRFGYMLVIAYAAGHLLRAPRPYWFFLSTASVMMGPTVTATLHRAIQRTIGTIAGAGLAAGILLLQPSRILLMLLIAAAQALSQLGGAHSYALTMLFYTPLGLLIVHGGHPELTTGFLISARLIDIISGCALGLAGTLLFDRAAASKRLPLVLREVLRMEGRLLQALAAEPSKEAAAERNHLRGALLHLRIVYDKGVNEGVGNRSVESLWPAVIAVQRLGFFLVALTDEDRRQRLSQESLAQLQGALNALACAVEAGRPPQVGPMPAIPEYPVIAQDLHEISLGLQVL